MTTKRHAGEFVFVHSKGVPAIVLLPIDSTSLVVLLVPRGEPVSVALVGEADLSQSAKVADEMQLVISARLGALCAQARAAKE